MGVLIEADRNAANRKSGKLKRTSTMRMMISSITPLK